MKKVMLITCRADFGGGPEHIRQLLENASSECQFYIAAPQDEPYWKRYSAKVGSERMMSIPHRKFTFKSLSNIIHFARTEKIDLIHSHGKGAGLYGRLASKITGIPSVHTPHGIHIDKYGWFLKQLYILYERLSSASCRHVIFVSESEKSKAAELGLWPKCRQSVINNGVKPVSEQDRLQWRNQIRQNLGISQLKTVISMISSFNYPKNMDEAYSIAGSLKEIEFLWMGDGEDRQALETRARKEGLANIHFLGFVDQPRTYLAASDIYLSSSRWEGMSLGMLEAMSVALPVVATDVTGNRDIVANNRNGFLYKSGQVDEAVELILKLQTEKQMRLSFALESQKIQEQSYSTELMARKVCRLYSDVLGVSSV